MPSSLVKEFRQYPATMGLGTLWVAVYIAIVFWQGTFHPAGNPFLIGTTPEATHAFGSITAEEVRRGEVWRALTATFIHGGLLHLGVNLLGFYRVGQMVEEWYGSALFLFFYVLSGFGGNLIAAGVRLAASSRVLRAGWGTCSATPSGTDGTPSVGGSIVLCGLLGLIAVVGWRSRTKTGRFMLSQVIWSFCSLALLGAIAPMIDNVGHAGGAVMGALIGLVAHRAMVRNAGKPLAKLLGTLSLAVILACGARGPAGRRAAPSGEAVARREAVDRKQEDLARIASCEEGLLGVVASFEQAALGRLAALQAARLRSPRGDPSPGRPSGPPTSGDGCTSWRPSTSPSAARRCLCHIPGSSSGPTAPAAAGRRPASATPSSRTRPTSSTSSATASARRPAPSPPSAPSPVIELPRRRRHRPLGRSSSLVGWAERSELPQVTS